MARPCVHHPLPWRVPIDGHRYAAPPFGAGRRVVVLHTPKLVLSVQSCRVVPPFERRRRLNVGPALAFLIVFYCTNAYKCYWEGRTLLGQLTFGARELYAKAICFSPRPAGDELEESARGARHMYDLGRFWHRVNILRYTVCAVVVMNATVQTGAHWPKVAWNRRRRAVAGEPWSFARNVMA
eukprot:gene19164-47786_t